MLGKLLMFWEPGVFLCKRVAIRLLRWFGEATGEGALKILPVKPTIYGEHSNFKRVSIREHRFFLRTFIIVVLLNQKEDNG